MGSHILYRLGQFLALILPRKLGYLLAIAICRLRFYISRKDREAVLYNMQRVLENSDYKTIKRTSIQVFENFGKYLVDFFRFSRINQDFINRYVRVKNIKYLDGALRDFPGVITLTAHIGNWELGGAVISRLGYPFYAVALAHAHPKVNNFFNNQRALCGVNVIPVGVALKRCYQLLKTKKIVAFLGDIAFGDAGLETTVLGRKALVPRGPANFCRRTKAAIVPGFLIRDNPHHYTLVFEEPIHAVDKSDRLKTEKELIEEYMKVIEKYMKQYPSQWYMFHPFFKE